MVRVAREREERRFGAQRRAILGKAREAVFDPFFGDLFLDAVIEVNKVVRFELRMHCYTEQPAFALTDDIKFEDRGRNDTVLYPDYSTDVKFRHKQIVGPDEGKAAGSRQPTCIGRDGKVRVDKRLGVPKVDDE